MAMNSKSGSKYMKLYIAVFGLYNPFCKLSDAQPDLSSGKLYDFE